MDKDVNKLKTKTLALFFTTGISLKRWYQIGTIKREVAIYNHLSKYFKTIYFFTYGDLEDLKFKEYLADNIIIIPKKKVKNNLLYSFLIPIIHWEILTNVSILKTNQMMGAWSAVLSKLLFKNRLIIRTGYIFSLNYKKENLNSWKNYFIYLIEHLLYNKADLIITSSSRNFIHINNKYSPKKMHIVVPNYIETDIFRPINKDKIKKSICFVGRLSNEKNLYSLISALDPEFSLTIIGSGPLFDDLKGHAESLDVKVGFIPRIQNHELPQLLNKHEIFILPSLYENMPKALLEAMSCGLPVIGTNVEGIKEIINNRNNGMLCETNPQSIKEVISILIKNDSLKTKLGKNARQTVLDSYSLDRVLEKELDSYIKLINEN